MELKTEITFDDFDIGDRVYKIITSHHNHFVFGTVEALDDRKGNPGILARFDVSLFFTPADDLSALGRPLQLHQLQEGSIISFLTEQGNRCLYEVKSYYPRERILIKSLVDGKTSWHYSGNRKSLEERFMYWELEG